VNQNLYLALAQASATADRPFMIVAGKVCSYGELARRTARMANALLALGLQPGERVVAQIDKSGDAIILYLATLRAGGVYLPLNTAYTRAEMEYFLADSEPRLLVCTPASHAVLQPLAQALAISVVQTLGSDGSGSLLELCATQADEFSDVERTAHDLAAILYTSGTTGRSKGAMLTHGNLVSNALVLRDCWRYAQRDCLLHALPVFHIHGLFVAVNITLAAGASLRLLPRFDPDLVFAGLPHCTVMMGVPTFYVRLLGDAPGMAGAHRARHPGALWHDRDQHEYLQSLRWRARAGNRWHTTARRGAAHQRPADRRRRAAGRDRHD
jgi:malonyl-CoA/methylmalonyl-CoA synthetase